MSNYLAIATVTATLTRIFQDAIQLEMPGCPVTTFRPGSSSDGTPKTGANLYLYHTTPNTALQNYDTRNRRPKNDLIKQGQAGLDLHYVMSFYGNDEELEPQRLLGLAVRTIVDNPVLTPEMLQETLNSSGWKFSADFTSESFVDRVTVTSSTMSSEDLSKIWSAFFQPPHMLSLAFTANAVVVEGNKMSLRALPVRSIGFYTTPSQPKISQAVCEAGATQPIVATTGLIIRGHQLASDCPKGISIAEHTFVKIGNCQLQPTKIDAKEIRLDLSSLPAHLARQLRAGVQSLQVLHSIPKPLQKEPERMIGSNVIPFVLCPTIQSVQVEDIQKIEERFYSAVLRVEVDLTVGVGQRVLLFLNERSASREAAYIFAAKPHQEETNIVVFPIHPVKAGEYLVRVQIDGAESPLEVDTISSSQTYQQYIRPTVTIE